MMFKVPSRPNHPRVLWILWDLDLCSGGNGQVEDVPSCRWNPPPFLAKITQKTQRVRPCPSFHGSRRKMGLRTHKNMWRKEPQLNNTLSSSISQVFSFLPPVEFQVQGWSSGSLLKIWEILNSRKIPAKTQLSDQLLLSLPEFLISLRNHFASHSPWQILGIPCGFSSRAEGRKEPQTTP